jgi:hypothetical protein
MTHRLIRLMLGAGTGLLLGGQLVIAADRIDLFDSNSNRTGYIIVDPKTKRGSILTTRDRSVRGGAGSPGSLETSRSTRTTWSMPAASGRTRR